jgi:predicted ArsR family transcriptional regulator
VTARRKSPPPERDATPGEIRALANPLRLRILRLCLDEALTNQEIATRLDRDPGTTLFHVRRLVSEGFLTAEDERPGPRGRIERPYRATGKSWTIRVAGDASHASATVEAVRQEIVAYGDESVVANVRLGVRLTKRDLASLTRRVRAIGDEYAERDNPNGEPVGVLLLIHRRKP